MITASDLSRTYPDGTVALASTNISIPKGQFVALIGPSGCGKSTLINLLAGLDQPTVGTAQIAGRSAMVFQEPALFPWLNIRDNIEFGGKLRGVPLSKRREQSDFLLKLVQGLFYLL
jgi:NitT/TauT family transport system ATP-binding protein